MVEVFDVSDVVARLRAAGSVYAEDEAAVLRTAAGSQDDLESMVRRRVAGEPLEVVVGWAEFCGHRVVVEPGVFVPRTRTGVLVDQGARLIGPGAVVVDLCCGTGAVGLALHARVDGIELHAADIDPAAVRCARRNLEPLGAVVHQGDLFDALPGTLQGAVDLLVVNAPYVPTAAISTMPPEAREHEPLAALDGGGDGVDLHRRVAAHALTWLAPGGHLLIETSPRQAALTTAAMATGALVSRVVADAVIDGSVAIGWAR
ncbi:putative protein N(5)-glutamine methyltransferase [Aeromicrobium sp. S22]|uniref:putative protein N(5)-glutamine methyltransferase n=1 Tax=Aeromicrobium sp. S22 TaxID=2662029 RepID=UPI00129EFA3C|nr:putative protein N(5)-glutamine methyltransferase [Aeromicrobium sp. S22]MRK02296.1 putative protein N(5)-glutamine methyltransferase [Aeromicrobium sp. S22]